MEMLREEDLKIMRKELFKYDQNRERVLKLTREAVRLTSRAITHIHRSEYPAARSDLKKAEQRIRRAESITGKDPWFPAHKNLLTAYQELAEAKILYEFAVRMEVPSLRDVNVEVVPYLLGLLDFIGELRRMTATSILKGDLKKAENAMNVMEGILDDLTMLNHTASVDSFRHKLDAARRIVEATRGDVVTEIRRWNLENALNRFEERVHLNRK
jgi:translin